MRSLKITLYYYYFSSLQRGDTVIENRLILVTIINLDFSYERYI